MEIVNNNAEEYAVGFTTPLSALLCEVLDYTISTHPQAHMISGETQGQLLRIISKIVAPLNILEIGTFTGYSSLCLCEGLQPQGALHTIELREADAATAQSFFNKSDYCNQLHLHVGNALSIIPALSFVWDLVFIDADKTNYIAYFDMVLPYVKPGGLIIADNVLFHGQVLEEQIKGKNAKAIHAFNEHIKNCAEVEQVLLTVRDGLLLIRKK